MKCNDAPSDAVYNNGTDYFCAACALNYQITVMAPFKLSHIHNAHNRALKNACAYAEEAHKMKTAMLKERGAV